MLTFDEILELRPSFKMYEGGMSMIDWFQVMKGTGWCTIRSGLRHADGVTKSPFHIDIAFGGKDADKKALKEFNKFWKTAKKKEGTILNQ